MDFNVCGCVMSDFSVCGVCVVIDLMRVGMSQVTF